MRQRSVDKLTLERWRAFDALLVREKLGCYVKADDTFEPRSVQGTQRYHINVAGQNFELLLRCPKFFSTRLQSSSVGTGDLVMHVRHVDFKGATDLFRTLTA